MPAALQTLVNDGVRAQIMRRGVKGRPETLLHCAHPEFVAQGDVQDMMAKHADLFAQGQAYKVGTDVNAIV